MQYTALNIPNIRPNRRTGEIKNCLNCDNKFYAPGWLIKQSGGKFCSHKCYGIYKVGHTPEPWNKGTKGLVKPNSGVFIHRKAKFKGSISEYKKLHYWIRKMIGNPDICSTCSSNDNIEWANKSGEYKWDIGDWIALCAKCHFSYDNVEERRAKHAGLFL